MTKSYSLALRLLTATALLTPVAATAQQQITFNAVKTIQAEARNGQSGTTQSGNHVTNVGAGDWLRFDNVNLGAGTDSFVLRYTKTSNAAAGYEVRVGSVTGPIIASRSLAKTPSATAYRNALAPVDSRSGTQTIFVRFTGPVDRVDRGQFGRAQRMVFQAERATEQGGTQINNRIVISDNPGEYIRFQNVRLGQGFKNVRLRYAREIPGNISVDVHVGSLSSPPVKTLSLPSTGSWGTFRVRGAGLPASSIDGVGDVFFEFNGDGEIDVDWADLRNQPLTTVFNAGDRSSASNMSFFFGPGGAGSNASVDGATSWLRFNNVSMSYNPEIKLTYARGTGANMRMEVRKGGANGALMGTLDMPDTGGYDTYVERSIVLGNNPQSIRDVSFVFKGSGGANIQTIEINRLGSTPATVLGQPALDNILVDQFGYKPNMAKVAVIRDGVTGRGSSNAENYVPGNSLDLVDANSGQVVFSANRTVHNSGAEHAFSGDRAWWFDFSSVTSPGEYYVYDSANDSRSATFEIGDDVYDDILKAAFRTFLYQRSSFDRSGIENTPWNDTASHLGTRQDDDARLYSTGPGNTSTRRDLQGGWYDAGDYNKYTNWTATYILQLLHAYRDTPNVWGDDFDMPESGNGIPDILDEIVWGLDSLKRHQNANGSVLSVLESDDSQSPPSSNTGQSRYGPASASATLSTAAAFALAAKVFGDSGIPALSSQAADLENRAVDAYSWGAANMNVKFCNAQNGVAAGEQEGPVDNTCGSGQSYQQERRRIAAVYLYDLTRNNAYQSYISGNWQNAKFAQGFVQPDVSEEQTAFMDYTAISGGNGTLKTNIRNSLSDAFSFGFNDWNAWAGDDDPYRAYIFTGFFNWGSNRAMAHRGVMYQQMNTFGLGNRSTADNDEAAAGYLHYLHGVNPFGSVYLSNMDALGSERSMDEFYHVWFADGTDFDNVKTDAFGPPPGYLVGGPNPNYSAASLVGLSGEPGMKMFRQENAIFENGNQVNPWELNENSNGYQIAYLRLIAAIVDQ